MQIDEERRGLWPGRYPGIVWILWFLTYQTKRVVTYLRKLIHQEYICIYSYTAYVIQLCLLWCTFLSILNAENNLAAQSDWTGIYIIYIYNIYTGLYLTYLLCSMNLKSSVVISTEQSFCTIWWNKNIWWYEQEYICLYIHISSSTLSRLHNQIMSHLQLIQLSYLPLPAWHTLARLAWLPITGYLKLHISFFFFAMRKLQLLLDFLRSLSMRARVLANQIVGPSEARTIGAWHGRQWDSWLAWDNAHAHACTYVSHCVSVCVCLFVCLAYPGQPLTAV